MNTLEQLINELRAIAPNVEMQTSANDLVIRGHNEHCIVILGQKDGVTCLEQFPGEAVSKFDYTGGFWTASGVAFAIAESVAAYKADNS